MARDINYAALQVPEDTDPEDYHYTHRRAELLDKIMEAGTPAAINQTEKGEYYGVDQTTIHHDLQVLGDYVAENIGEQAHLESEAVYSAAIEGLLEEAESGNWRAYKALVEVIDKRNEWLGDIGKQHREPDRSEVDVDADVRSRALEAGYHIVEEADEGDADAVGDDVDGTPIEFDDGDEDGAHGFSATPNDGATEVDTASEDST